MMARIHVHRIFACALALAGLAGSDSPTHAADAQTGEQKALVTRIERLERDLRDLQREYYSRTPAVLQDAAAATDTEVGRLAQRVAALEESLRTLTGQVESLTFSVQQIQKAQGGAPPATFSGGLAEPSAPATQSVSASVESARLSPQATASSAPQPGTLGVLRVPQGTALPGDEKAQLDAAMDVLYRGDYAGGAQALKSFVEQNPKSPYVSEAQYWLGEANYTQRAYREAATAYLTVVEKYPKSDKAPQSMVKLGMSLIAAGQTKDGCATLGQVREMFPKAGQSVLNMARLEREKSGCK